MYTFLKFILIIALTPLSLISQRKNHHSITRDIEVIAGIGCANYLGELGGQSKIGTHKSPVDLEFQQTRPALMVGFRKLLSTHRAVKINLSYAQVSGNDKLTNEPFRQNRNLNFKSNILELNMNYEIGFRNVQKGQRYLSRVRGVRNKDHYTYFFAGIGAFYYNPKGYYKGSWHALQPLGTEGQGLNGKKKYSRIAVCVPIGVGFKVKVKQRHNFGIEFGYRITFTDYLDDVSTTYFNISEMREQKGDIAAHFADPSLNNMHKEVTAGGEQRGNALQKDGYFILTINYSKESYRRNRGMFSKF